MRAVFIAGAIAVATGSVATAQSEADHERLISPTPRGFFVYYSGPDGYRWERTEFPLGQSRGNWRRRLLTQRYWGAAEHVDTGEYAKTLAAQVSCAGSIVSPIEAATVSGRPASQFQIDCPRGATGQPEVSLYLVVAGKTDMHIRQFALRGAILRVDLDWARSVLTDTEYCDRQDKRPACQ